ncbi:hypothetical protein E9549_03640 [Blastococcus sp. MG754426]|uniref:hypothetical protein n=1 Tax=unclassified Blastococcus TaxID=2619396 RepID=UPI001EF01C75|nr:MULTISPECIES: hypothetical protein [unclassified Blastococcus]MCF6506504.1 hypothetical protein [Blastococcus sp. MG754426]MCF6511213.1 hypothetical protein [Blastococcus sp. MG754427]MCF6734488.1 hypothetical protein [Blastococcus sp. KM273129]
MPPADDESRWAEAQSLLERAPTPSAEERLRHWRRVRVASVLALGAAAAVLFAGQWVVSPTAWRLALVAVLSVVLGIAALHLQRDVARVRAFLGRHPAGDGSAA